MTILAFIWKNRLAILIGILILVTVSYIVAIRIQLINSEAARSKQAAQIEGLSVAKQMLENEKAARAAQDKKLSTIRINTSAIEDLVAAIPEEVKRSLKNEKLELLNDCIVDYNSSGLLSDMCKGLGTQLPASVTSKPK
jgi:hypothetical protein